MTKDDSILHSKATSRRDDALVHPTNILFDPKQWDKALAEIENPTLRDTKLAYSAIWFGIQLTIIRKITNQALRGFTRSNAIILAIAQSNRDYATMQRKADRARRNDRNKELVDIQYAGQRPLSVGFPGNDLPFDDLNDALVDTLPSWLYSANLMPEGRETWPPNLTLVGMKAMSAFSFESTLGKLWQQALWLNWHFTTKDCITHFLPDDMEAETLRHAWLWRLQGIAAQTGFTDLTISKQFQEQGLRAPRIAGSTVIGIDTRHGRKNSFIYGPINENQNSDLQRRMWSSAVETSYLSIFLDSPLPTLGISCNALNRAWCVIADVCGSLRKKQSGRYEVTASTIRDWALVCGHEMLVDAVAHCCDVTREQAKDIVSFLTYDGTDYRRGLWSMPIVKIPGEPNVSLCYSPIEIGNPIRRAEQWLERGGLTDRLAGAKRGTSYEAFVREEICDAIKQNQILSSSIGISNAIKPSDKTVGDIDAAFRVGNTVVVAEVKCLLTPSEPIEQYRYRQKIISASKQSLRKTKWLKENFDKFKSLFGCEYNDELQFQPIVILNQGFGHSLRIQECLVCDIKFLLNYLSSGKIITGAAVHGATGNVAYQEETYYTTEDEAAKNISKLIEEAPTLRRYVERTKWHDSLLPCHEPPYNRFSVAGARLLETVGDAEQRLASFVSEKLAPQ